MHLFLRVYGILALVFFVFFEVISIILCRKANAIFIRPIYQTSHVKTAVSAVFFPFVILIALIEGITESILERTDK